MTCPMESESRVKFSLQMSIDFLQVSTDDKVSNYSYEMSSLLAVSMRDRPFVEDNVLLGVILKTSFLGDIV